MTYLQPFFLLIGRASAFWIGAGVLAALSILLAGLAQPDEVITPYIDAVFLASFAFPAAAGWLGSALIQEFLHCTFAWPLPSVLRRIAAGYLVTGLAISLLVAGLATQSPTNTLGFGTLLTLGLAGYCIFGNFFSPRHRILGSMSFVLAVLLVARSRYLSSLALAHPLMAIVISLGVATVGILGLFSRDAFRQRAFRLMTPFPGSYSLERTARYERAKLAQEGPRKTGWGAGYLAINTWSWVRATLYESWGALGWRTIPKLIGRLWVLGLLFAIYAWSDKGDLSFGEAFGKTIYGALFSSPHVPAFGDQVDRHPMVIIVIAAIGSMLTLWSPTGLKTSLAYPISRRRLATLNYLVGLVDSAAFFVGIFVVLSSVGHLAGSLVGYPIRFDFMPFFLHPLLGTVILIPLSLWGRLHLSAATQRKRGDTLVALIFGLSGFIALVWIWTASVDRLFTNPTTEILVVAVLIAISQSIYAKKLRDYFRSADLI